MYAAIFQDIDGDWPDIKVITVEQMQATIKKVEAEANMSWEEALDECEVDSSHDAAILLLAKWVNLDTGEYRGPSVAMVVSMDYASLDEEGWMGLIGDTKSQVGVELLDHFTRVEVVSNDD